MADALQCDDEAEHEHEEDQRLGDRHLDLAGCEARTVAEAVESPCADADQHDRDAGESGHQAATQRLAHGDAGHDQDLVRR